MGNVSENTAYITEEANFSRWKWHIGYVSIQLIFQSVSGTRYLIH